MSHLIILSGNSLKNRGWGELVEAHYGGNFESVYLQQYDHWESGEPNIDFVVEGAKLADYISGLGKNVQYVVFAKSAGSLLLFTTLATGVIESKPIQCVFFGIPFDMASTGLFENDWTPVENFSAPAIAFHNVDDPTTSYEFTKETLEKYAPQIELITTEQSDHWYGDFVHFDEIALDNFLI